MSPNDEIMKCYFLSTLLWKIRLAEFIQKKISLTGRFAQIHCEYIEINVLSISLLLLIPVCGLLAEPFQACLKV